MASRHEIYEVTQRIPKRGWLKLKVKLKRATGYACFSTRERGILTVRCKVNDKRIISLNGKWTGFACPRVGFFLRPGRYRVGFFDVRTGCTKTVSARIRRRQRTLLKLRR